MSYRKYQTFRDHHQDSVISQSDVDVEEQKEDPFGYIDDVDEKKYISSPLSLDSSERLPTKIVAELIESIQPATWYNIPPPVVKAVTSICEIIKVLEKRFLDTNSHQTEKTKKQTNNFRKLEKSLQDKEQNLLKLLEQVQRTSTDKLIKQNSEAMLRIELAEARFEELSAKVQRDRELVDTRLSRIDDSIIIKKWAENLVNINISDINTRVDGVETNIKKQIEKIYLENLIVPGLIGENEKYKNMRDYTEFQNLYVEKSLIELENKTVGMIQKDIQRMNQYTNQELSKLRNLMNLQIENLNKTQNDLYTLSQEKLQQQIQHIQENINKVEKSLDKDIFEAHERIDELSSKIQNEDYIKEFADKIDDLKRMKEQISYEIKQSEQRIKKRFEENNKERKDFAERIKKQIEKLSKQVVVNQQAVNNMTTKSIANQNSRLSNSPKIESKFGMSLSPKISELKKTPNLSKKENNERSKTLLHTQQDKQSQLQNLLIKSKDQSQNSEIGQAQNKHNTDPLPIHYIKEIERIVESKLKKHKHSLQQQVQNNLQPIHQTIVPKQISDSVSIQDGKNFLIGYKQNQAILKTNRQSDKQSSFSMGNQQNLQIKKQFLSTQQHFTQHLANQSPSQAQQSINEQQSYRQNKKLESIHNNLPQTDEHFLEESQQRLIMTTPHNKRLKDVISPKQISQDQNQQQSDKVSYIHKHKEQIVSGIEENVMSGFNSGNSRSKQENIDTFQNSVERLKQVYNHSFENQTLHNENIQNKDLQHIHQSDQTGQFYEKQRIYQSQNRDKFKNFAENTVKTMQKYEKDVKNTFRIPPIIGNSSNTLRNQLNMTSTSIQGFNSLGEQSSRNLINQSHSIDNSHKNINNRVIPLINNTSNRNEVNRSYNLTIVNLSASQQMNQANNYTSNQNNLPIAVKFEKIDEKFDF